MYNRTQENISLISALSALFPDADGMRVYVWHIVHVRIRMCESGARSSRAYDSVSKEIQWLQFQASAELAIPPQTWQSVNRGMSGRMREIRKASHTYQGSSSAGEEASPPKILFFSACSFTPPTKFFGWNHESWYTHVANFIVSTYITAWNLKSHHGAFDSTRSIFREKEGMEPLAWGVHPQMTCIYMYASKFVNHSLPEIT